MVGVPLDFSRDDAQRWVGRDHAWRRNLGLPPRIWKVAAGPRPLFRRPPVRPLSICLRVKAPPLDELASMRLVWYRECQGASSELGVSSPAVSCSSLLVMIRNVDEGIIAKALTDADYPSKGGFSSSIAQLTTRAFIRSHHDDGLSPTMRALACFLQLGTPGQAAHSSNRRMISMSLHPKRMREPHNMKGTP